jgi:fatty-acyl-CoA synthase
MRDHGIGSWTARRARKTPHRLAVVHQGTRHTYGQLHDRTTRLAHHLRALGVGRGDRVAFLGPNQPAFLETLFASARLGAVFVPLNTRLAAPELTHCLTDSGASLLVYTAAHEPFAARCGAGRASGADGTDRSGGPSGIPGVTPRLLAVDAGYERVLAEPEFDPAPGPNSNPGPNPNVGPDPDRAPHPAPLDEPVTLDDTAMIMYTSGTTGRAKGAVLTHGNLTWNAVNTLVDGDFGSDEVTLLAAPMFHTAALNMTCLPTFLKGGTLVLEESFSPARTLDLVEEHRVTVMFGVPAMYQQVAAEGRFATADLSSVRVLLCGGAPVPPSLIRTYAARGVSFVQGYGMTEASPGVCLLDAGHALAKAGSAGVPHFFNDVRIVGPSGEAAGRGELLVEGPTVMSGYWNRPRDTSQALTDGWLHTGDVAVTDTDGYLTIVDRVKDVIISGGENVYPAEVEQALYAHPDVADCAVIGVPDERWGEVGRAVVVLREGARADAAGLLAALDGRLARYKIPASVVFAADLPRGGSGKLLKRPIRARYGAATPPPSRRTRMTTARTTADGLDAIKALAGTDLGRTDWMEITQDRVDTFADATGDHQWIHVDPERAKAGPFGAPIAHGYLTLSLVIPLFDDLLEIKGTSMGINYGLDKVRFPTPVRVGARIRLHAAVGSVEDVKNDGVEMRLTFTVEVEDSAKPACVAAAVFRHYA